MARPQKCGMDYFPHDTDALTDEKIEALRMLYGNDGYAFYFIMLERIYRTEHFELDVSDAETIQILCKKLNVTEELFNKMLSTALKRGCFDADCYEKTKKLTSTGIKRRANVVIEKRIKSKNDYAERVSATETQQETPTETPQKVHKGEERKGDKKKKDIHERFDEFWLVYPRKVSKDKAVKSFGNHVKEDEIDIVIADVIKRSKSADWTKDNGQYIPHPTTYLNQRRWEEVIEIKQEPTQQHSIPLDMSDNDNVNAMLKGRL
jgi:hypothetical protein